MNDELARYWEEAVKRWCLRAEMGLLGASTHNGIFMHHRAYGLTALMIAG